MPFVYILEPFGVFFGVSDFSESEPEERKLERGVDVGLPKVENGCSSFRSSPFLMTFDIGEMISEKSFALCFGFNAVRTFEVCFSCDLRSLIREFSRISACCPRLLNPEIDSGSVLRLFNKASILRLYCNTGRSTFEDNASSFGCFSSSTFGNGCLSVGDGCFGSSVSE